MTLTQPDRVSPPAQGAHVGSDGSTEFVVWSPFSERVDLHLTAPHDQVIAMTRDADGYHRVTVAPGAAGPGARYLYRLHRADGSQVERPDPASRAQPDGVHAASQVVHLPPLYGSGWRGLHMSDLVCYELHVGAFTPEGTFTAIIPHLDTLRRIGITAIELMPVAAFPGRYNWGYDGVYWYAAQQSYGGANGLRALCQAAHARGMAVLLDVVYNHLGPEGNYLAEYGPYFTGRYVTPWGKALNLEERGADDVRAFITHNLAWWVEVGVDGFRLDAVQELLDITSYHILHEIADTAAALSIQHGRKILVIAESNLNDPRLTDSPDRNGFGLDGEWADDFHHAVHAIATGERMGYYADFGELEPLARAIRYGYARTGAYSQVRGRRHGTMPSPAHTADRFVVFVQNHDQIGNRLIGDRLTATLDDDTLRLLAAILLLSPYVPLLFMGEEYAETAPFPFFVDYGDAQMMEGTRRGRAEQMHEYGWAGTMPDPGDPATFHSARLNHALRGQGRHKLMQDWYTRLLALRAALPALHQPSRADLAVTVDEDARLLTLHRWHDGQEVRALFNFGAAAATMTIDAPRGGGAWALLLCSWTAEWGGSGESAPERIADGGALTVPGRGCVAYAAG